MPCRKCKGRPRKPLAEVILKCAPLRATSSGIEHSMLFAKCKCLKNRSYPQLTLVVIAEGRKELLSGAIRKRWECKEARFRYNQINPPNFTRP